MTSALRREKMTENLTSSIESEFYISIRLISVLKHDLFNSSINCFLLKSQTTTAWVLYL